MLLKKSPVTKVRPRETSRRFRPLNRTLASKSPPSYGQRPLSRRRRKALQSFAPAGDKPIDLYRASACFAAGACPTANAVRFAVAHELISLGADDVRFWCRLLRKEPTVALTTLIRCLFLALRTRKTSARRSAG